MAHTFQKKYESYVYLKPKTRGALLFILSEQPNHDHDNDNDDDDHLSLIRKGRWGTMNDFATSFLHFPCSPLPSGTWRTPGLSVP